METLLSFIATSFTSPSDLSALEGVAAAATFAWGTSLLVLVRILGRPRDSKVEERTAYDEAA